MSSAPAGRLAGMRSLLGAGMVGSWSYSSQISDRHIAVADRLCQPGAKSRRRTRPVGAGPPWRTGCARRFGARNAPKARAWRRAAPRSAVEKRSRRPRSARVKASLASLRRLEAGEEESPFFPQFRESLPQLVEVSMAAYWASMVVTTRGGTIDALASPSQFQPCQEAQIRGVDEDLVLGHADGRMSVTWS